MPAIQTTRPPSLVEGHAERPSADMRIDFSTDMIGREKADDIALPNAAIKVVVIIENDVLGPVNLAQTDDLHVSKAVVHRIGRRAVAKPRRWRQSEIGWRHIDPRAQLVAPLAPSHVDGDRQQQNEADHHRRGAALEPKSDQPVRQQRDDDGAHQGFADRAAAAADAVAAEERSRDRREFEAEACVGAGAGRRAA